MDSRTIREIEVNANERVVIQVRSHHYIRLEFETCVIGIREEDGVVYSYQEPRQTPRRDNDDAHTERESYQYSNELWGTDNNVDVTPQSVVDAAGGHFHDINEIHARNIADDLITDRMDLVNLFDQNDTIPSILNYDTDDDPVMPYHYGDTQHEDTQLEFYETPN